MYSLPATLAPFGLTDDADANLAALATLSAPDLISLETALLADFDGLRAQGGRDSMPALSAIAGATKVVRAERETRPERDAGAIEELATQLGRPSLAAVAAEPVRDAAYYAVFNAGIPERHRPRPRIEHMRHRFELVGTREEGDLDAVSAGVAEAYTEFARSDSSGVRDRVTIGRLRRDYPESRIVSAAEASDAESEMKLGKVLDDAENPDKWTEALIASGGFCAPPAVAYDFPTISGVQRPVWDYLPGFRADRGALTFMTPFGISKIVTSTSQTAGAGVSVWTNTIDITPGGTTKPKQTVDCPAQQTVTLQAVVQQLQVGNFIARALPEMVVKWSHELLSAHARLAETLNLTDIDGASNPMTVTKLIGATGDLVMSVRQAASRYRNNQRMAPDARLRVLIPAWVVDFIAADISQRHAGDGLDIFGVNEGWVRNLFNVANVNVTFYQDAGANATQQLGAQGPTDIRNWPLTVVWYLFHEGAFLGLDGGTLDVGLVRDSTLNGTNNFQMFSESFEKVAFRGLESQKVTQTICPTGEGVLDHAPLACAAS